MAYQRQGRTMLTTSSVYSYMDHLCLTSPPPSPPLFIHDLGMQAPRLAAAIVRYGNYYYTAVAAVPRPRCLPWPGRRGDCRHCADIHTPPPGPLHHGSQGMTGDEGTVQIIRVMFKATEDTEDDDLVPFSCPQSNAFEQLMQLWRLSTEPNSVYAQRRGPLEDIRWRRYHVHTHRNNSRGLLMTIQEYHPDPTTPISTMAAFDPLVEPKKPSNTKLVPTTGGSNFHVCKREREGEERGHGSHSRLNSPYWDVSDYPCSAPSIHQCPVFTSSPLLTQVQWDVFPTGSYEDEELYDWVEPDQWLSKTACTVTDHFTGQYTICCRPPAHAAYGISKLTIMADFINYEPYQSIKRGKPRQLPILSTRWMGREASKALAQTSELEGPLPSPLRGWPACPGGMSQLSLQGEWMAMGGAYRWADPSRQCVTPVLTKDEVLACYTTEIDSLTLMGDSHLRQMANWFYGYFGVYQIKQGEIDSAYVPKVRFLWTTTGLNLAQRLQYSFYNTTLFMGRPLTQKDILVLDTAHWDLWETEVTPFTQVALPHVVYTLQKMR